MLVYKKDRPVALLAIPPAATAEVFVTSNTKSRELLYITLVRVVAVARQPGNVWMHAATRRCGHPADSSDLATGAAGAATSTPSLLRRRSDRGLRLMPGPVTAGDPVSPSVSNTDSETYRRSGARQPRRHWAAGSGRPQCRLRPTVTVRVCLRSATLSRRGVGCAQRRLRPTVSVRPRPQSMTRSPLARPRGRAPTVSAKG